MVVATGTVADFDVNPTSRIGPYLTGRKQASVRTGATEAEVFEHATISLTIAPIHTVHALELRYHAAG